MIKKIYEKLNKNYIIIILIAVSIFIPYIKSGIIRGDDYICHIANLFSIDKYISLKDFNLLPSKINPVMANNMGYGNAIFYPQLSYWGTILIHLIIKRLGFTLISSIKVFEFITVILSGIMMYKMMETVFKNPKVALTSAIIYMCSPYFLNDVFLRMAYTEMMIFIFIPIIFIAIYHLFNKEYNKFIKYFVIGYCGMILSHLVITVFFTIILLIILLINIKQLLNKEAILSIIISGILILGITAPFTVPMIEHKINGEYIVFQPEGMANIQKIHSHRLNLEELFLSTSKKKPKYVSTITLILAAITIINYKNLKKDKISNRIFVATIILTLISIIMTLKIINWNYMPKLLWNIQFPWRMCTFISFGFSVIAGISMFSFENKEVQKILLILICVILLTDVSRITHLKNINKSEVIKAKDVSSLENKACGARREYLPLKAKENIEYLKSRNNDILIKKGKIETIEILENKTPYLKFKVNINNMDKATLEIPRLYYLGYSVNLQTEDGDIKKINYYENDNGFIEFEIDKSGTITVCYSGTFLYNIARIISIVSIIVFVIILNKKKIYLWTNNVKNSIILKRKS